MSKPTTMTVAIVAPAGSDLAAAIAAQLTANGVNIVRDPGGAYADAAVVVAGSPASYGIEADNLGGYLARVVNDATATAKSLTSGPVAPRSLVFVSPPLSDTLTSGISAISTASGALLGLSRALVVELGDTGLRVNVIQPGLIRGATGTSILPTIPLDRSQGRLTTPEDIADAVGFLTSNDASYITGSLLDVDGGLSEDRHAATSVLWDEGLLAPGGPGLAALLA